MEIAWTNILMNVGRDFAKIISEGISCFLPFLSMLVSAPVIEGSWRNHQGAPFLQQITPFTPNIRRYREKNHQKSPKTRKGAFLKTNYTIGSTLWGNSEKTQYKRQENTRARLKTWKGLPTKQTTPFTQNIIKRKHIRKYWRKNIGKHPKTKGNVEEASQKTKFHFGIPFSEMF